MCLSFYLAKAFEMITKVIIIFSVSVFIFCCTLPRYYFNDLNHSIKEYNESIGEILILNHPPP